MKVNTNIPFKYVPFTTLSGVCFFQRSPGGPLYLRLPVACRLVPADGQPLSEAQVTAIKLPTEELIDIDEDEPVIIRDDLCICPDTVS